MTNRPRGQRAFTLIELIVVIGIIAILAGLLLPAVSKLRKTADIDAQKQEFQSIAGAIANYKNDFGKIPINDDQPTAPHDPSNPDPYRLMTLASALIGPGPAVTQYQPPGTSGLPVLAGDGSDDFGFRAVSQIFPTGVKPTVPAS